MMLFWGTPEEFDQALLNEGRRYAVTMMLKAGLAQAEIICIVQISEGVSPQQAEEIIAHAMEPPEEEDW